MKKKKRLKFLSGQLSFVFLLTTLMVSSSCQKEKPKLIKEKVSPVISLAVYPFPLSQIKILEGPFREMIERNRRYLLELDPDRLLHNFRLNAGLTSQAKPLGGWEEPK
ncbi:MAG: glycoside hydrolase family 127 protein, partial [Candidatus Aminicenantes bacterium]|nr:glycoside hydrolase family 127 protein [Candidatus Aminicenantes bacterium]